MLLVGSPILWGVFAVIIIVMLWIDIGIQHRHGAQKMTLSKSLIWSIIWVAISLCFAFGLWLYLSSLYGVSSATKDCFAFLTGYVLEKSLAIDNIFVWLIIFNFFSVSIKHQKRVVVYGVVGAIVLRTVMIFAGSWLITRFDWILYLFGIFLLFTGGKMLLSAKTHDKPQELSNNRMILWLKRLLPIKEHHDQERFIYRDQGKIYVTTLFLVMIVIELSDVVFAVDSIPAIFAVSKDPFIVLTSNIFAILGLRSMYFLLANIVQRVIYLKYGLSIILIFIGVKMVVVDVYSISVMVSLSVIILILAVTLIASWLKTRHR